MAKFMRDDGLFHLRKDIAATVNEIVNKYCSADEEVYVGITGAFKEYLIATDQKVYIYKTSYQTGNTFGFSIFQLDYNSISAVQLHTQFGGAGYIEIVGIGMQNRSDLSYWSTNNKKSASHQDNCLSFGGNPQTYEAAVTLINKLMMQAKNKKLVPDNSGTLNKFDEIKQYKELLDLEIITEEEFRTKKDELLNS